MPEQHPLVAAIAAGEPAAHTTLTTLSSIERAGAVEALLETPTGRRWLREFPDLDATLADRMLAFESDFRQPRRDRTLVPVVERASRAAIAAHLSAVAASPAAPSLWRRLAEEPAQLVRMASALVAGADAAAAEATLHLLVLDPLDPFRIGESQRSEIAAEALGSTAPEVRGLAAEYLAEHNPVILQTALERLLTDDSQRVRGIAWDAALRVDGAATVDRATALLSDESVPVPLRRSALVALGTQLPTAQMVEVLAYFVVHPEHELAADAANLLYRQHRNPITATAARDSPHADVREIAERLLDPLRGSPAAGGSRPGDPTRSSAEIFAEMIQQLEARADNQNNPSER